MGFSDISSYGGEIETPNLDRLAAGGMRFSQMYNMARCCPSRAALLTGLNPHQTGIGHMVTPIPGAPGYQGYLNDRCVTIAEVLGQSGYRTCISGKWHCGSRPGVDDVPPQIQRGFERVFGYDQNGNYFFHPTLIHDDQYVRNDEPFYLTDLITDNAVKMVEENDGDDRPFFLHVAYTAPHWPLQALEEDIAKYEGMYDKGWDAVRTARHEELNGLGILSSNWKIAPRDESVPEWASAKHRSWESARMAVYAAQIDRMDQGIGKILDALESQRIAGDTLVLFLSDNGGCAELLCEDTNMPDPLSVISSTHDGRPITVGNNPDLKPGGDDTYMSYDIQWANVSNAPFRRYKHWVHEGGISTPFIASWPGQIEPGICSHQPAQMIDITATCIDLAGAVYPHEYKGHEITPLEGESFRSLLKGGSWSRNKPIFWEHEGNRAVRIGQWKLVGEFGSAWELYDMHADRTELNNLAASETKRVEHMASVYTEWANRCGVLDWPVNIGTWDWPGGLEENGDFRRLGNAHVLPITAR
jgi:arylsulfatase